MSTYLPLRPHVAPVQTHGIQDRKRRLQRCADEQISFESPSVKSIINYRYMYIYLFYSNLVRSIFLEHHICARFY